MKYIWESCDIRPGRRLSSHNRAEQYLIGYDPSVESKARFSVTSLIDGQTFPKEQTAEALAKWMNEVGNLPDSIVTDSASD